MARSRLISKVSGQGCQSRRMKEMIRIALTLVHLDIDRAPPDIVFARLLIDNALVFRAPPSLLSRKVDECTRSGDDGSFVPNGILVKLGNRCIALEEDLVHIETGLGEVIQITTDHYEIREDGRYKCAMQGGHETYEFRIVQSHEPVHSSCEGCEGSHRGFDEEEPC